MVREVCAGAHAHRADRRPEGVLEPELERFASCSPRDGGGRSVFEHDLGARLLARFETWRLVA
jgi:hypothetical protein